ncbi:MAG: sensor histidine kinase, partial [Candidatus Aphodocola sp.]
MSTGIFFSIEALIYIILLLYVFFGKKVFDNEENKIYSWMIIIVFFEIIFELILYLVAPLYKNIIFVSVLFSKIYLMILVIWILYFGLYAVVVSFSKKNDNNTIFNKVKKIYILLYIVYLVLNIALPINFYSSDKVIYTLGPCVYLTYAFFIIYLFLSILSIIFNRKGFKDKRLLPLGIFLIFGGFCGIIQLKNPGLLLATPVHAFITFLMYFTIENPDVMMIEELNNNRKLIEKTNEDKLNLLFELSQEVKEPIESIENEVSEALDLDDLNEMIEKLKKIKASSKQLSLISNNILNVSNMDLSNIKIENEVYKPNSVFTEMKKRTEEKLKDKDIEFRYIYSSSIPDKLYGDPVKLKQILTSFLNNAVEVTKTGFIELKVNSIIKYDVCRLIITITDSGIGMDIDKVNEILSANTYDEKDFEVLNNLDVGT